MRRSRCASVIVEPGHLPRIRAGEGRELDQRLTDGRRGRLASRTVDEQLWTRAEVLNRGAAADVRVVRLAVRTAVALSIGWRDHGSGGQIVRRVHSTRGGMENHRG